MNVHSDLHLKIPITMCHGVSWQPQKVKNRGTHLLTGERFQRYFEIAAEMDFESISYADLAAWWRGEGALPARPILFDFDHPDWSIHQVVWPIMESFGYRGNLFVNTSPMEKDSQYYLKWDDLRDLVEAGWHFGAHTHHHYDLGYLAKQDPTGKLIRDDLELCDRLLEQHLGIVPVDFAYTSTTWSKVAEEEVKRRYRFARLWIIGENYRTDEGEVRYADLVGADGPDEADGGPPFACRYVTRQADPYRLPSMELEYLIFDYDAYRRYLEGALEADSSQAPD